MLRVDVIEAGFAVSSPGDFESVKTIADKIRGCSIASLARCTKTDIDAAHEAIKGASDPRIHIFLATSPIHMQYKLRMTPDEVLETVVEMVKYARSKCANVEFSAEDAMRSEPEFLVKVAEAAIKNGASVINIPDTVGYSTPIEMRDMIEYLIKTVPNSDKADFSVHCHNDLGMATANSLAGVLGGARQIECTLNGLGERAGNAPLEEVVMAISTRKELYGADTNIDTTKLFNASMLVYNIIGRTVPMNKPVVGSNAFAHEAGIHQHGVLANRLTYEIMTPESIGIKTNKMVLGKHSGRHAFETKLSELGFDLSPSDLESCFAEFKKLCDKKKEVSDSDIEALARNRVPLDDDGFSLERFSVYAGNTTSATSVVVLRKGEEKFEEVSLGDGPIDAAFKAVDKIISPPEHSFENYATHSVSEGKDTLGEVAVTLKASDRLFVGKGLSTDTIEASILAYLAALNKLMTFASRQEQNQG